MVGLSPAIYVGKLYYNIRLNANESFSALIIFTFDGYGYSGGKRA